MCRQPALDHAALAHVAGTAKRVVLDCTLAFDRDLVTFEDVFAIDFAGVELGLTAAETHSGELLDIVGDLEEALATREKLGAEVRPQAIADHRDAVLLGDVEELANLLLGQKLSLINQDTGNLGQARHRRGQIQRWFGVNIDFATVSATRGHIVTTLGVDLRFDHNHVEATFLVVVGGLDERITLAAIHCTVLEVKLSHEGDCNSPGTPRRANLARNVSQTMPLSIGVRRPSG